MTDFRALCAELLEALECEPSVQSDDWSVLRANARTALAQPEPQGPTDEDIYEWGNSVFLPSLSHSERLSYPITDKDLRVITRAVLARWRK